MTFIALLWAAALAWALITGNAVWFNRKVARTSEPIPYWTSVVACALMALLFVSLGPVR